MANTPTGDDCRRLATQGGTVSQALNRDKSRALERVEAERRAAEEKRRRMEAEVRRGLAETQKRAVEAQRQMAEIAQRQAEAEARRQAEEAHRRATVERQRQAEEEQRRATEETLQRMAAEKTKAKEKFALLIAAGLILVGLLVWGACGKGGIISVAKYAKTSFAQFDSLVTRLKTEAQRNPAGYRRKVFLLALFGYAFPIAILTALLLLTLWATPMLIAVKSAVGVKALAALVLCCLAIGWMILSSMHIYFPPIEGNLLTQWKTPKLFQAVEGVRTKLNGPPIHQILLTGEYQAAVTQRPRLGMFGNNENILILGLPLMHAFSLEEFTAVLAHEFGHLSGEQSRMHAWVYRTRRFWMNMLRNFDENDPAWSQENPRWFASALKRFVVWYAPLFNAYSFVLAREHEYEADRCAARLYGAKVMARALTTTEAKASFLEERFWPAILRRADEQPKPDAAPFSSMGQALADGFSTQEAATWVQRGLRRRTAATDTHLSLADRLRALRQPPGLATETKGSAAQHLLGDQLPSLAAALDKEWRSRIHKAWVERHRYAQEGKAMLLQLEEKTPRGRLLQKKS
jgi:Zn-dependent protease with chaperone function